MTTLLRDAEVVLIDSGGDVSDWKLGRSWFEFTDEGFYESFTNMVRLVDDTTIRHPTHLIIEMLNQGHITPKAEFVRIKEEIIAARKSKVETTIKS